MALLLINEETPVKEIIKYVFLETGLNLKITYKREDFSNSTLTIYQIWNKIKIHFFLLRTARSYKADDFIIINGDEKVFLIQEELNLLFGLNFSFTKENQIIDSNTRFGDLISLETQINQIQLNELNEKLNTLCIESYEEMKLYKNFYFSHTYKNEEITDFEIKLDIQFQLNKKDPLFSEDSDNFIFTFRPFCNIEYLSEFKDKYIDWEYSSIFKEKEINSLKKPNRLIYELLRKMDLSDICRIGDVWCDINYISQKFISIH